MGGGHLYAAVPARGLAEAADTARLARGVHIGWGTVSAGVRSAGVVVKWPEKSAEYRLIHQSKGLTITLPTFARAA
ncbi:hypothetical protein Sme01_05080 [Sphaerisporangium melleum]|uniref:Uncharacterized protein n=1 Tax=Sphaerisporangium melleum TaxID=321316 RepID=A0A917QPV9_9ACTN|nr:hypothetical protein GCM10007964_02650 [Sphaerisporangium melleum]GII68032.1 hypothetical protein Sme01_05080 [Sphaerisporangium melleum]